MIVQPKTYVLTFLALMGLTVLTVVASFMDLGAANLAVALAIAGIKGAMVVLIFMHIRGAHPLVQLVAASGFIWLGIMIFLSMTDYLTRGWLPTIGR